MKYVLNIGEIKKGYRFSNESKSKVRLTHLPGNKIKILPYSTKLKKDLILNFFSILGEFSRLTFNKGMKEPFKPEDVINTIVEKVNFEEVEDKVKFKAILKELFFDSEGKFEIFHPIIFNYLNLDHKDNKKIAEFLFTVLWDEELGSKIESNFRKRPSNIMLKLVYDCLPKLDSDQKLSKNEYKLMVPKVYELFNEDFIFLIGHQHLFVAGFEKLLKYYYFFYVSQLSITLNRFFDKEDTIETLYFNLDWESTSKTRTSYSEGWLRLNSDIKPLFSHVNCLEFLNYNNMNEGEMFSYRDLKNIIDTMETQEKEEFEKSIIEFTKEYKNHISDIDWDKFVLYRNRYEDSLLNNIFLLFKVIDYQFNNSVRKKPYNDYQGWFEEFCKKNFLKRRGSLGYTLNITEDYLLFMTKLCIKDREKIRLKSLFDEYRRRGLEFDRDSQDKIIQLFEKLNLLEKKSDSGDAQYVKSIL